VPIVPSEKRRIVVLASGTRTGGGSGFEWLVEATLTGVIPNAEVVAVVSNHLDGGVAAKAARLGINF
jgi:folate-dependent phosphoribosylglycinamide formyltransferase PurN